MQRAERERDREEGVGRQEGREKGVGEGEAGGYKQFVVDRGEASWKLVGHVGKIRKISAMIHVELVGTHPLCAKASPRNSNVNCSRSRWPRRNLETEIRNRPIHASGYYIFERVNPLVILTGLDSV